MTTKYSNTIIEKNEINKKIDSVSKFKELRPIIQQISLNKLKQIVKEMVNDETEWDININIKYVYWNTISIDKILSTDIIQHILSFQALDSEHIKYVNKQWNKLSMKNEKLYYLKLFDKTFSPYDENINTTFIVRWPKNELTVVEKDMGFEMLSMYKDDDNLIRIKIPNNIDGNRFIIHKSDKFYKIDGDAIFNKDLSIIGIPGTGCHWRPVIIFDDVKPFFNNELDHHAVCINNCKLRIEKCQIKCWCGSFIKIDNNSSLLMNHSIINGTPLTSAIKIKNNAKKIIITKTKITGYKHCIELNDDEQGIEQLICKCNIFKNNKSYSIIKRKDIAHEKQDFKLLKEYDTNVYKIEKNKCKSDFKHDGNKIYTNN